jgi:hypothetical protein
MGKELRDKAGFYSILGKAFISSTTVLDKIEKRALHGWIARTTAEYIRDEIILHLKAGDMTVQQLVEMDLEAFMKQAKKAHEDKKRAAMDLGTAVHTAIEDYYHSGQDRKILDGHCTINPDLTSPIIAFLDWEAAFKVLPRRVEMTVYSEVEEYAGTLDLICEITPPGGSGPLTIVNDHKASTAIYDTNVMQVASYFFALEEMEGELNPADPPGIDGAGILRLDKETGMPEFRLYDRDELLKPYMAFLSVLDYCKWERSWKSDEQAKRAALRAKKRKPPKFNPPEEKPA